jgi:predicted kinase
MRNSKIFENEETKSKKIYVLVGPPSVGKSTWIKETFKDIDPYIINRDDLAEKVAEEYGWTYDDMFVTPPADSNEGDTSDKYGNVVKAPSYMNWPGAPKLVYDKVVEANGKVQTLFTQRVAGAKGKDNIVVDMTNMNAGSRKGALKAIEGQEGDYHKIAVVFNFKGAEDIIKKVAAKRAEDAKKMGKSKTISSEVIDRMIKNYQEITSDEGFDEVIGKDNTEELKKVISNEPLGESKKTLKYIKKFESFKK